MMEGYQKEVVHTAKFYTIVFHLKFSKKYLKFGTFPRSNNAPTIDGSVL